MLKYQRVYSDLVDACATETRDLSNLGRPVTMALIARKSRVPRSLHEFVHTIILSESR